MFVLSRGGARVIGSLVDDVAPEAPKHAWAPTRAFGRAVALVGVFLVVAVFMRRPDVVTLAAPIAIGAAIGLWRRPQGPPSVRVSTRTPAVAEGDDIDTTIEIRNPEPLRYDLVVVRLDASPWLRIKHGGRPYATAIKPGALVGIDLEGRALRWGRHPLGPAVAYAVAADGLMVSPPGTAEATGLRVYPATEAFRAGDMMPRAAGMVGAHRSRRPGEGGELAGVRMFMPGDRLRRIDWRVSLRTRQLHVAATLSDRDAEIVILLDLMHEAGRSGGIDGARSVLDIAVRAAAGIAEHYLTRGDRVGFVEYGWPGRRLRASTGHRHFLTSLEWLLDTAVSPDGREPSAYLFQTNLVRPNALTIVLTPMITTKSAAMLARLVRGGRFVVAVDTMPPELLSTLAGVGSGRQAVRRLGWLGESHFTAAAARLWLLERANTVAQLREHGVPMVTWSGAGSLDEVLKQVTQLASAPQAVRR